MRKVYIPEKKHSGALSVKDAKLAELKTMCAAVIGGGVDVETSQGLEHFSLSTEDQINIQNLALQVAGGAPSVLYHADGNICRPFAADEVNALAVAAVTHVTIQTTLYNHLKAWAQRTDDESEISAITYDSELPADLAANMAELLGLPAPEAEADEAPPATKKSTKKTGDSE
jgi:hypothetical protein